jgi:hypothetical protein
MNERQWELYRLSVVEQMPDSPYKQAVIDAINHKLMMLDRQEAARLPNPGRTAAPVQRMLPPPPRRA